MRKHEERSSRNTPSSGRWTESDSSSRLGSADSYGENIGNQTPVRSSSPRGSFYGKGPKGWKRSDERIKDEVCEVLYRAPDVDASYIEVSVKSGLVSLKGSVSNRLEKRLAESWVENLTGVDDVQNELKITRDQISQNLS